MLEGAGPEEKYREEWEWESQKIISDQINSTLTIWLRHLFSCVDY